MTEAGTLSIVRRGPTYQIRYASCNPYTMDRPPYACPDEGILVTLLRHWGIDAWSLQQAVAVLRKGSMAVVPLGLSQAQIQAYFPLGYTHGSRPCTSCCPTVWDGTDRCQHGAPRVATR